MNADFPRVLTLLRKEKQINQKNASEALGITQSLLSHYEKGKRECGLDFVVKCAVFYNVSCDYLLGVSPQRDGGKITAEELPDVIASSKNNVMKGSILPMLNKKLITNSLHIIFDLLLKTDDKKLTVELSTYLMLSVYDSFRILYGGNPQNQSNLFSISEALYQGYSDAEQSICKAKLMAMTKGSDPKHLDPIQHKEMLKMSTQQLSEDYQTSAQSLFNLIQNIESKMDKHK